MKRILFALSTFLLLGSLSASIFAMAAASPCSTVTSQATCASRADCTWRWEESQCTQPCATLHSSLRSCAMDTECEWNPFISACQERCSSHSLKAECMAPTCKWYGNASNSANTANGSSFSSSSAASWLTNGSYCGSDCARFTNSLNCSAVPSCMWFASSCTTNPWQPAAQAAFVLEILSAQLSELLAKEPDSAVASFALAVQQDLTAAYGSSTSVVVDSRGVAVNLARLAVTVDYLASTSVVPTVITNDVMQPATWLTSTNAFFAAFGGTTALIVGSVMPLNSVAPVTTSAPNPQTPFTPSPSAGVTPAAQNSTTDAISTTVAVLIAIGCTIVVAAFAIGVAVLRWRHNPYAKAPPRRMAVQRFTPEEYDWLKAMNERVITYEEAIILEQQRAALGLSISNGADWLVVAHCEVPGRDHRNFAMRPVLSKVRTELFPVVFEHLTHIRIALDEHDCIRVNANAVDPIDVLRFNNAFRLQIGKATADIVLLGAARFIVVSIEDNGACRPYDTIQTLRADTPDSCNLVKELFESSQLCSHVGGNDARKVAYARLAAADSFLVPALSDSGCEVGLRGVPRSWAPSVVETAVKLMIRVGCRHLVEGASPSWAEPHVRAQPSANAVGEWRISVYPPQALGVLVAVSCRFWGLDGDVLCCQCTSGIAITPAHCFAPHQESPDGVLRLVHTAFDVEMIERKSAV